MKTNIFPAMLLVAGTCIGGGMIALPVAAGVAGFFPSIAIMLFCWLAMTLTAVLLIEVNLWHEEGAHMITMSANMLGPIGKALAWLLYLFIAYASLVAYTAEGGEQLSVALAPYLTLGNVGGCILFIALFGIIIDFGAKILGRINTILVVAMIAAYFWIIYAGSSEVNVSYLLHQRWSNSILAIPFLLTAFSFQTMVPSLTPYLNRNPRHLYWALLGGTTLALVIYVIWLWLVLGIVPVDGLGGLDEALQQGKSVTSFFRQSAKSSWLATVAEFFAFFAIVTSFLGIGFGLYDFLGDGLGIPRKGWGKLALGILIAIPTLLFAIYWEGVFLAALDLTGGFGDTILNGMMPVLMVWIGRYHRSLPQYYRGGKLLLVVVFLFFLLSLTLEVLVHTGFISQSYNLDAVNVL